MAHTQHQERYEQSLAAAHRCLAWAATRAAALDHLEEAEDLRAMLQVVGDIAQAQLRRLPERQRRVSCVRT